MITLYSMLSNSPNIQKIIMMLKEVNLPYRVHKFEFQENGKLPSDFLLINPNGTVPVIQDDETGSILYESAAILYYLAEKSGKLLPADLKEKGEVMKWLIFEAANIGAVMGELYHYMLRAEYEIEEVHLQRYKSKIVQFCSILEIELREREYLCGKYSIADIAIYPWMIVLEDIAEISMSKFPNLGRLANKISQTPAANITI